MRGELHKAESRIKDLEGDLREANEAAHDKAEELSEAIARLRAFEKGNGEQCQVSNEKFHQRVLGQWLALKLWQRHSDAFTPLLFAVGTSSRGR